MILVDSNVILDAFEPGAIWHDWSSQALIRAAGDEPFINPIVAAEVGVRVRSEEELADALGRLALPVVEMTLRCSWLAGRAHLEWIRNGGRRGALLSDIIIGAHAVAEKASVLTRDPRRFRTYFPELELMTPESGDA